MNKFPKAKKTVEAGLMKIERVKKLVVAASLGASLTLVGSPKEGFADVPKQSAAITQINPTAKQGALLLAPGTATADQQQMAQHYSHSSHSSHQSHYSHYSSR
jgi:hypothetical protein